FQSKSRRRDSREHVLKFHELREILQGFGFEISDCIGRTRTITKDGEFKASILDKGGRGKEDYDKQYISKLRKKLKLTPAYGVDSYLFYGEGEFSNKLNAYMRMRDKVMR